MKKVQIILKVTNGCNLRCKYCYNAKKFSKTDLVNPEYFRKFLEVLVDFESVNVIFHGGEPLCGGIQFYKDILEIEDYFKAKRGMSFTNVIQTNGTLLNSKWISFLKKNNFQVGISYDGIYNEQYRGSSKETINGIKMLKEAGIIGGALAVVADPEYDMVENYKHFKELGVNADFSYVFLEGNATSIPTIDSVTYTNQLKKLFDLWLYDKDGIQVRYFMMILRKIFNCQYTYCFNGSCVGNYYCLDNDGTIYGCSRESALMFPFGNIKDINEYGDILNSEGFRKYILGAINRRASCAKTCPIYKKCYGGCNDYAINGGDINQPNPLYCTHYKAMYEYIEKTIKEVLEKNIDLSELNPGVALIYKQSIGVKETENV